MDDVACNTTIDVTLQDCSYKDEHHENCGQNEGAGVECHNDDPSSEGKTSFVKGQDWKSFISGILIVGGSSGLSSAEVFNPDTGVTCSVEDMPEARSSFSLCHGLVCGGRDGNDHSR